MKPIPPSFSAENSHTRRFDPRAKLSFAFLLMITCLFADSFPLLIFIILSLFMISNFMGIGAGYLIKNLRKFIFFFLLIILIPAFFGSGFVLFEIFGVPIIKDGLLLGSFRALQFAILIAAASMINASTSFMEIGDSIRILLKPIAGKTANKIAIVLSITMRFVPILQEEAHRILDAQKARGAFLERNLLIKLKQMTTLIVPIFNSVFRKADILARSLDGRGYNFNADRTHYVKLKLKKNDFILISLSIILLIFALYTRL